MASWSRVQGTGVPTVTALEIAVIWLLSIALAVPEAVGFNMVTFDYKNVTMTTCMLQPKTPLMTVSVHICVLTVGDCVSASKGSQILCMCVVPVCVVMSVC